LGTETRDQCVLCKVWQDSWATGKTAVDTAPSQTTTANTEGNFTTTADTQGFFPATADHAETADDTTAIIASETAFSDAWEASVESRGRGKLESRG